MAGTSENTRKTAADFRRYFDFLTKAYGLKIIMESASITGGDRFVCVLRNQFVQVELAGDQSYFHAEIRRLIDGEPRPYWDEENNIGFEDLAVLATNNNYDHFDFYPASAGWRKVLENCAALFKKSKEVFTSNNWVDTSKIEALKNEAFFKRFGYQARYNKEPGFFQRVRKHALQLLDNGFKLRFDNSEMPPYSPDSMSNKIILEGFGKQIKISQRDWRDDYTNYYIAIDGEEMFQLDTNHYSDVETAAKVFNEQIDKFVADKNG